MTQIEQPPAVEYDFEAMAFELGPTELAVLRDWQAFTGTKSLHLALLDMLYHCDADREWVQRHPYDESRRRRRRTANHE